MTKAQFIHMTRMTCHSKLLIVQHCCLVPLVTILFHCLLNLSLVNFWKHLNGKCMDLYAFFLRNLLWNNYLGKYYTGGKDYDVLFKWSNFFVLTTFSNQLIRTEMYYLPSSPSIFVKLHFK